MSHFFKTQKVVVFKTSDFNTELDEKTTIKNKSLCIVLFHDHSHLSSILSKMWQELSEEIPGCFMCACDLLDETEVAQIFVNLAGDETSPYRNYARHSIPFIIAYKNGKLQRLFSDVLDKAHIINFITSLTYGKIRADHEEEVDEDIALPSEK